MLVIILTDVFSWEAHERDESLENSKEITYFVKSFVVTSI